MAAALLFEPDGYVISGPRLMGRHAAGHGFLRAAVAGRLDEPLWAYTPHKRSAAVFAQMVHQFDPAAETRWLPANRPDLLAKLGTLYLPTLPSFGCASVLLRIASAGSPTQLRRMRQ
jgi:starch synthase